MFRLHNSLPERRIKLSKAFEKLLKGKFNLQESYPSLILGAIIVVILGLLVANFISRRSGQQEIDMGAQTEQTPQEATAPRAGSEYTIRENDSLSKISQQVYGTQELWPKIAGVNNLANPNRILVGDKLQLPAKEELAQVSAVLSGTSYQVQKGETFFTIAKKVYGDGSKWPVLHRANGLRRLPNGNPLVFADSTIVVPR
ncbi:LysM peptidoglycan-binding domain-containing protein [Candidatus Curtissbacteria bacterium]|nr:LysM peptidoglycan-binding domain-containing protein [Candidatus Curtissbacteria bacterium]